MNNHWSILKSLIAICFLIVVPNSGSSKELPFGTAEETEYCKAFLKNATIGGKPQVIKGINCRQLVAGSDTKNLKFLPDISLKGKIREVLARKGPSKKSNIGERSDLRTLIYTKTIFGTSGFPETENIEYKISKITQEAIEFENGTGLYANFIHDGGQPYSPGHANLTTFLIDKEKVNSGFLNTPKGTTMFYKVQEEWNNDYGMLWQLKARIAGRKNAYINGKNVEAVDVRVLGESIEQTISSSWAEEGIKFKERLLIHPKLKIILSFERVWESTTSQSPPKLQKMELKEYKLANGALVSLEDLSRSRVYSSNKRVKTSNRTNREAPDLEGSKVKLEKKDSIPDFGFKTPNNTLLKFKMPVPPNPRYWSGHKGNIEGDNSFTIEITYSDDGKSYEATLDHNNSRECRVEGDVSISGVLSNKLCHWNDHFIEREVKGTVEKIIIDNSQGGNAGGDELIDKEIGRLKSQFLTSQFRYKRALISYKTKVMEAKHKAVDMARRKALAEARKKAAEEARRKTVIEAKRKAQGNGRNKKGTSRGIQAQGRS